MIKDQQLKRGFAGVYLLEGDSTGTQLGLTKTPTKFQRFCAKLFLGWKWVSIEELKNK